MGKTTVLIRQCIAPRQSRPISSSPGQKTSTSPQRRRSAVPATAQALKPFTDIPGPIALPMLRHSAHVLPRIGSFHHTLGLGLLEGLRDKYGDLVRLAKATRTRPVLYVFDPEIMREVYESRLTDAPVWEKSPLCQHRKVPGQPAVHSEETKAIWAGIKALLQDSAISESFDKVLDDIAADATRRLSDLRHADNALNEELETEIYRWALETIGVMIFGSRLGCLDGSVHIPTEANRKPEKTSMDDEIPDQCSLSKKALEALTPAEHLVRCTKDISDGSFLVRSESTLKADSQTFNNALETFDKHFSLIEHFLTQALHNLNAEELRPEQILLARLRPLGPRMIAMAADAFLAGVDPLAQSAISMFYHLSLHAARQQRAHGEITWSHEAKSAGAACPQLPYLSACAAEALRLHPATGGVVRRCREGMRLGGFEVPAGVDIVLAHGVTSKSEEEWGRAKAFIPERWLKDECNPLRASRAHPNSSMPFGETCPASGVVGKILSSLATRVIENYRLEWHGPPPSLTTNGVNKLQPPYYFVLQNAA